MEQGNEYNKEFTDKTNPSSDEKIEDMEDWRNEHGEPSFIYLQALVNDGSPEALEKLRAIASDLDVQYGPNTTAEELLGKIRSAVQDDPNTTS